MEKIILIGGGGHCKVVIDAIRSANIYSIEGILDGSISSGVEICGVSVIGDDRHLDKIYKSGVKNAFITLGSSKNCLFRGSLYRRVKSIGYEFPAIIHPSAVIARDAVLDEAIFIAAGVVINPGVKIARNAIINTSSSIDHDCVIGESVHIAPGVNLSGGVIVERLTHIGTGTVVNQGIHIGEGSLVGSGSVVLEDIGSNLKAFGNPCRIIGEYNE